MCRLLLCGVVDQPRLAHRREGELDDRMVELELPSSPTARMLGPWSGDGSMQDMVVRVDKIFGGGRMGRGEKRKMKVRGGRHRHPARHRCRSALPHFGPRHGHGAECFGAHVQVSEARPLIEEQEADRYINNESVTREAIQAVEQDGESAACVCVLCSCARPKRCAPTANVYKGFLQRLVLMPCWVARNRFAACPLRRRHRVHR